MNSLDVMTALSGIIGTIVFFKYYTSPGSSKLKHVFVYLLCLSFGFVSFPIALIFSKQEAFEYRYQQKVLKKLKKHHRLK